MATSLADPPPGLKVNQGDLADPPPGLKVAQGDLAEPPPGLTKPPPVAAGGQPTAEQLGKLPSTPPDLTPPADQVSAAQERLNQLVTAAAPDEQIEQAKAALSQAHANAARQLPTLPAPSGPRPPPVAPGGQPTAEQLANLPSEQAPPGVMLSPEAMAEEQKRHEQQVEQEIKAITARARPNLEQEAYGASAAAAAGAPIYTAPSVEQQAQIDTQKAQEEKAAEDKKYAPPEEVTAEKFKTAPTDLKLTLGAGREDITGEQPKEAVTFEGTEPAFTTQEKVQALRNKFTNADELEQAAARDPDPDHADLYRQAIRETLAWNREHPELSAIAAGGRGLVDALKTVGGFIQGVVTAPGAIATGGVRTAIVLDRAYKAAQKIDAGRQADLTDQDRIDLKTVAGMVQMGMEQGGTQFTGDVANALAQINNFITGKKSTGEQMTYGQIATLKPEEQDKAIGERIASLTNRLKEQGLIEAGKLKPWYEKGYQAITGDKSTLDDLEKRGVHVDREAMQFGSMIFDPRTWGLEAAGATGFDGLLTKAYGRGLEAGAEAMRLGSRAQEKYFEPWAPATGKQVGRFAAAQIEKSMLGVPWFVPIKDWLRVKKVGGFLGERAAMLPELLRKRWWDPLSEMVADGAEGLQTNTNPLLANHGPAGALMKVPISAGKGAIYAAPFATGPEKTPYERGQVLGMGAGLAAVHATPEAARDASMSTLFFRDPDKYQTINAPKIDYGTNYAGRNFDQAHNAYVSGLSTLDQQKINDNRALIPKVEQYTVSNSDFQAITSHLQNNGLAPAGNLRSRGFNILYDPATGKSMILINGDHSGFEVGPHEIGHSIYHSMTPQEQSIFKDAALQANDAEVLAAHYFNNIIGRPVTYSELPTEAGIANKTEQYLPGLDGYTREQFIEEMGAETVSALLRGQPLASFTRNPGMFRRLQFGAGRVMEKMGIPMTPEEARTVLGVKPSVTQMWLMDKALRDYFKRNPANVPPAGAGAGPTPKGRGRGGRQVTAPTKGPQPTVAPTPAPTPAGGTTNHQPAIGGGETGAPPEEVETAVRLLKSIGRGRDKYSEREAREMIQNSSGQTAEELVRNALKHRGQGAAQQGQFRTPGEAQEPPVFPHPTASHRIMKTDELGRRAVMGDQQAIQTLIERHGVNWLQALEKEDAGTAHTYRRKFPEDAAAQDARIKASEEAWQKAEEAAKAEGRPAPRPVTPERINELRAQAEAEVGAGKKRFKSDAERETAVKRRHLQMVMEEHSRLLPSGYRGVKATVDPETGRTVYYGEYFDPTDPVHQWLLSQMDPEERRFIGQAQDAIQNGRAMNFNYTHATPAEGEELPTGPEREEAYEEEEAKERAEGRVAGQVGNRTALPISVGVGADGQGLVYSLATDKVLANALKASAALRSAKMYNPYRTIDRNTIPIMLDDMRKVAANHAAGYRGDGSGALVGTKDRPVVRDANYVPQRVTIDRAQFINMILDARDPIQGPRVTKAGRVTAAGKAVEFAEANKGYTAPIVSKGQERTEVNPMRQELNKRGAFTGRELEHGYEQFRADLMKDNANPAPAIRKHGLQAEEIKAPAPIRRYAAAGFMPMVGERAAGFGEAEREGRTFITPLPGGGKRFEISDRDMAFRPAPAGSGYRNALEHAYYNDRYGTPGLNKGTIPVGRAIDHPELFRNYPLIARMRIRAEPTMEKNLGYFEAPYVGDAGELRGGEIALKDPTDKETLAHELQHVAQTIERWSGRGANPDVIERGLHKDGVVRQELEKQWKEQSRLPSVPNRLEKLIDAKNMEQWINGRIKKMAEAIYELNAGEIEARAAEQRAMGRRFEPSGQIAYTAQETPEQTVRTEMERAAKRAEFQQTISRIPGYKVSFMPEIPPEVRLRGQGAEFEEGGYKRYQGAPPGIRDARSLRKLKDRLIQLAQEGEAFRHWYREGAEAMMRGVGYDPTRFERSVANIAASSPQNRVYPNAGMAVRALAQQESGGRRITIGKGEQMKERLAAIGMGDIWEGVKTNQFYRDHMAEFDKRLQDDMGSTMDMHMARAFGYPTDSFTPQQSRWSQGIMREITEELGWGRPKETQAAVWSAIKGRFEKVWPEFRDEATRNGDRIVKQIDEKGQEKADFKDAKTELKYRTRALKKAMQIDPPDLSEAAFNFGDALKRDLGYISYETRPRAELAEKYPWMRNMSPQDWIDYHRELANVVHDPDGTNKLAKLTNLISLSEHQGFSAWGPERNLSQQLAAVMPKAAGVTLERAAKKLKAAGKPEEAARQQFKVDPTVEHQVKDFAAATGLLYEQAGVGYHRPYWQETEDVTHKASNGILVNAGRNLTADETGAIVDNLEKVWPSWEEDGKKGWYVAPEGRGLKIVNWGDQDNNKFYKVVNQVVDGTLPESSSGTLHRFASYGDVVSNNWKENPNGEVYRRWLSARRRPDILRAVDDLRTQVDAVNQKWARDRGGERAPGEVAPAGLPGEGVERPVAAAMPEGPAYAKKPPTLPAGLGIVGAAYQAARPSSQKPSELPPAVTQPTPRAQPVVKRATPVVVKRAQPAPQQQAPSSQQQPPLSQQPARNPNGTEFPPRIQAVDGSDPAAVILHHTNGRPTVEGVIATARETGYGAEYVVDRQGNVFKIADAGSHQIKNGWGPGEGLNNQNTVGIEVIAEDNNDVNDAQKQAVARFIQARYPRTPLFGHGEVNPGHKEADEGQATKLAALAYRERGGGAPDKQRLALQSADQIMRSEGASGSQNGRPEIYGFREGEDNEYPELARLRASGDERAVQRLAASGLISRANKAGSGQFNDPAIKAQIMSLAHMRGVSGARAILNDVGGHGAVVEASTSLDPNAVATINSLPRVEVLRRIAIARAAYDKRIKGQEYWNQFGKGLASRYDREREFYGAME